MLPKWHKILRTHPIFLIFLCNLYTNIFWDSEKYRPQKDEKEEKKSWVKCQSADYFTSNPDIVIRRIKCIMYIIKASISPFQWIVVKSQIKMIDIGYKSLPIITKP